MEVRQGANARDVKGYDTERLRNDFLIQNLFPADDFKLVYSQIDRITESIFYQVRLRHAS